MTLYGNITKISDNDNNIVRCEYSPTGFLTKMIDADGVVLYAADTLHLDSKEAHQATHDTAQPIDNPAKHPTPLLRPEGPLDFIAKIRQWRADTIAAKAEKNRHNYSGSLDAIGLGGVNLFWLSNRDGSGGVETDARGNPVGTPISPPQQAPQQAPQQPRQTSPGPGTAASGQAPLANQNNNSFAPGSTAMGQGQVPLPQQQPQSPWTPPPLTVQVHSNPRMGNDSPNPPAGMMPLRGGNYYGPPSPPSPISQDIANFNWANNDPGVVFSSNIFSAYNGALVFNNVPLLGSSAASFGAIFLGSNVTSHNLLMHERGHIDEFRALGPATYTVGIAMPSLWNMLGSTILPNSWQFGTAPQPGNNYFEQVWEAFASMIGGVPNDPNILGGRSEEAEALARLYHEMLLDISNMPLLQRNINLKILFLTSDANLMITLHNMNNQGDDCGPHVPWSPFGPSIVDS